CAQLRRGRRAAWRRGRPLSQAAQAKAVGGEAGSDDRASDRLLLPTLQPQRKAMTIESGFELIGEQDLPEANSRARRYRHLKTGADLLSLANTDENKVFGVAFRTPPPDSTGLPHILEHS